MDEVYINVNGLLIDRYFDKDIISIHELISLAENLHCDVEHWKEEYEDLQRDLEDNYRPIPIKEQVE